MNIAEEYKNQVKWRNWESYIDVLPIKPNDKILDLGCSRGYVTKLLSQNAEQAIGIDLNEELLELAKKENNGSNINYYQSDLSEINQLGLSDVDGIWSSFTIAYFPDFAPVLKKWLNCLKPGGWIAIVEMDDLFAHKPISTRSQLKFKQFYQNQRSQNVYDFEMGRKIRELLVNEGLTITYEDNIDDAELTFNGSAETVIISAWESRLDRIKSLKEFLGMKEFIEVKKEFLSCLSAKNHKSDTIIKYLIARKDNA